MCSLSAPSATHGEPQRALRDERLLVARGQPAFRRSRSKRDENHEEHLQCGMDAVSVRAYLCGKKQACVFRLTTPSINYPPPSHPPTTQTKKKAARARFLPSYVYQSWVCSTWLTMIMAAKAASFLASSREGLHILNTSPSGTSDTRG